MAFYSRTSAPQIPVVCAVLFAVRMMAHMMAHQESKSVRLPYQLLNARGGIYFSSIVLSMWDNIHGPTVLMTWKGKENEVSVEENEDDGFIVMSQATTGSK